MFGLGKGRIFAFFKVGPNIYGKENPDRFRNKRFLSNQFLEKHRFKICVCEDNLGNPFLEVETTNINGDVLNKEIRRISGVRSRKELSIDEFIWFKPILLPYFQEVIPIIYLATEQLLREIQSKAESKAWGRKQT